MNTAEHPIYASGIIPLNPPQPAPTKAPRSPLAVAALIAALVPLPLMHTLAAAPLALASVVSIVRSRVPMRGIGLAVAALAICFVEWVALGGLALWTMGEGNAQQELAEEFLAALEHGSVGEARALADADLSTADLRGVIAFIEERGGIEQIAYVTQRYHGLHFGNAADHARHRQGEYTYDVTTPAGAYRTLVVVRGSEAGERVEGIRLTPIDSVDAAP